MGSPKDYARAIVAGIASNRTKLGVDECGRLLAWIGRVAPEVTADRAALAAWIAVECKQRHIELTE